MRAFSQILKAWIKGSGRPEASLHGGTTVSEVRLHLLLSHPHALHEVNTSLEKALVQALCTHASRRWLVSTVLPFPKVSQRHSFATPTRKSLARCSGGMCGQAEIGILIDERKQRYTLLVHCRNASRPPARLECADWHRSYEAS